MDSFLYSINATVPIFLVMIIGWVIKQLGVIDDHFANVANKYVFKVALPVLLFRDLAAADFKSQKKHRGYIGAFSAVGGT